MVISDVLNWVTIIILIGMAITFCKKFTFRANLVLLLLSILWEIVLVSQSSKLAIPFITAIVLALISVVYTKIVK